MFHLMGKTLFSFLYNAKINFLNQSKLIYFKKKKDRYILRLFKIRKGNERKREKIKKF